VQYLMLVVAVVASLWIIIGGVVVEPPAALMEAINRSNARILRLLGRPVTA
jgi:lipopolysaccharide export system permease protein